MNAIRKDVWRREHENKNNLYEDELTEYQNEKSKRYKSMRMFQKKKKLLELRWTSRKTKNKMSNWWIS